MRKLTTIALAAVLALVLAATAGAATISGGTTAITPSPAALNVLAANGITLAALTPATTTDDGFAFPIARGHVNRKLHGRVFHRGGLSLTKGTRTVTLRRPTVVSTKRGAWVFAAVRRAHACQTPKHHGLRCHLVRRWRIVRVARVVDPKVDGTTITATLKATPFTAHGINALAGKSVVHRGAVLGTATIAATLK